MRRKVNYKRDRKPDAKYGSVVINRFTNYLMRDGKKSTAEKILRDTFEIINKQAKQDPVKLFEKAMENAAPAVETATRRVGGANYQVPVEVRPDRKFVLAARWLILAARTKKGKPMAAKLAEEIIAASKNEGAAIKKKLDMHRMAEANRAFAHFSW